MDRPGAVTSLLVILITLVSWGTAEAQNQRPSRTVLNTRWTAGFTQWTESLQLSRSDGRLFDVGTSVRALSVGYQVDWMKRTDGWFLEGQAHLGESSIASLDSDLNYTQQGISTLAGSLTAIKHWNFERPRLFVGIGLSTMVRQSQFNPPADYSFGTGTQKVLSHLKLDLSFPIFPRTEVIQQFGVPLDGQGHFWQIGFRRL